MYTYPPAPCFAKAGVVRGAPGNMIEEVLVQSATTSVSIESNRVIFNLHIQYYSNSVSYILIFNFPRMDSRQRGEPPYLSRAPPKER